MEATIIDLVIFLIGGILFVKGVLVPLTKITAPVWQNIIAIMVNWSTRRSPVEQQRIALQEAQQRIKVVSLQKETMLAEKEALKIQNSIIDEEFFFLDEKPNKKSEI